MCRYVHVRADVCGSLKGALDPLVQELRVVLSCWKSVLGRRLRSSAGAAGPLNC